MSKCKVARLIRSAIRLAECVQIDPIQFHPVVPSKGPRSSCPKRSRLKPSEKSRGDSGGVGRRSAEGQGTSRTYIAPSIRNEHSGCLFAVEPGRSASEQRRGDAADPRDVREQAPRQRLLRDLGFRQRLGGRCDEEGVVAGPPKVQLVPRETGKEMIRSMPPSGSYRTTRP